MKQNSNSVPNQRTENIRFLEKVSYGSGDLASNLIMVLTTTYATFFYTDALGLNPAVIGSILMFSKLLDGFSDIAMGFVMDKVHSKHGKARGWLLWLAVPIGIATVMMFAVPNLGNTGKYIYVAVTYNVVSTFLYTMINIPYGALNSLITRDQDQRMVINVFRMFMAQVGQLVISGITLPLVNAVGGSQHQKSWIIVSVIYGVIAAVTFLFCFANTKERVTITNEAKESISIKESLQLMLKNNYWLLLAAVWVFLSLYINLSMMTASYYAKYVLGNENTAGALLSATLLTALVVMLVLPFFIRKLGKRNVALIGCLICLAAQFLMLLRPSDLNWLMFCAVLRGIAVAAMMGTIFAMVADTIEYGHWKTGKRIEGVLYSTTTFGAKIGAGLGPAIALWILGTANYDGMAAVQSEKAVSAIKLLYLYLPIPLLIVIPVIYMFYRLDKKYPAVIAELEARENRKN